MRGRLSLWGLQQAQTFLQPPPPHTVSRKFIQHDTLTFTMMTFGSLVFQNDVDLLAINGFFFLGNFHKQFQHFYINQKSRD